MNLIYFYSDSCGSCKGYEEVVDRLSTELKVEAEKQNIRDGIKYIIKGVPCIILEKDDEKIFESVGNLPYDDVLKGIREVIDE